MPKNNGKTKRYTKRSYKGLKLTQLNELKAEKKYATIRAIL